MRCGMMPALKAVWMMLAGPGSAGAWLMSFTAPKLFLFCSNRVPMRSYNEPCSK